jgi:hypothetical protein
VIGQFLWIRARDQDGLDINGLQMCRRTLLTQKIVKIVQSQARTSVPSGKNAGWPGRGDANAAVGQRWFLDQGIAHEIADHAVLPPLRTNMQPVDDRLRRDCRSSSA